MTRDIFSAVLGFTGDRTTFAHLRVLSFDLLEQGEMIREAVLRKQSILETLFDPLWTMIWPDIYLRMEFWTPWSGERTTFEANHPHFQQLWEANIFRRRGHDCGKRYVTMYGSCECGINWHYHFPSLGGRWICWQTIYFKMP